jgi:hypothetical protein
VTLHLVRAPATPPPAAVAETDWIVYRHSDRWHLADRGAPAPPVPAGPIDHAQLAHLVLAADRTVTW